MMLKKLLFAIMLIISVSCLFGCTENAESTFPQITYSKDMRDGEVARDLTEKYLHQKNINNKIEEIKVIGKNRAGFVFTVTFAENNFMYVNVSQQGNTYKIERWETSP